MRYLFDVGNTRVKWGVEEGGRITSAGAFLPDEWSGFVGGVHPLNVSQVAISTVSSVDVRDELIRWSRDAFGLQPFVVSVKREFQGVKVAYEQVENLGVDRWLAMLGAWGEGGGACVVVDAGTTITVDYVGASGDHKGGLIVPGVDLMRSALFDRTSAVKVDKLSLATDWRLGCDTVPCVSGGISAMIKGFLNEVVQRLGGGAIVVLSGGDAETVREMLDCKSVLRPHLVLEGLVKVL